MTSDLILRDVHAGYGDSSILNGIDMTVGPGETLAVLGPNGSGKSTMAKTLLNLTTHHSGTLTWDNRDITGLAGWRRVRAGIGYVPQRMNVFGSLTVEENLAIGVARSARRERSAELARVMERFPELSRLARSRAGHLSGGERRILALAVTLLGRPRALVLDEPTSDLAPVMIDRVMEILGEVRAASDMPIVLVEQNVERALSFADRVCVLRRGKIVLEGAVADVSLDEIVAAFMEFGSAA